MILKASLAKPFLLLRSSATIIYRREGGEEWKLQFLEFENKVLHLNLKEFSNPYSSYLDLGYCAIVWVVEKQVHVASHCSTLIWKFLIARKSLIKNNESALLLVLKPAFLHRKLLLIFGNARRVSGSQEEEGGGRNKESQKARRPRVWGE